MEIREPTAFKHAGVGVAFSVGIFTFGERQKEEVEERDEMTRGAAGLPARWSPRKKPSTLEVHPWSVPYGLVL